MAHVHTTDAQYPPPVRLQEGEALRQAGSKALCFGAATGLHPQHHIRQRPCTWSHNSRGVAPARQQVPGWVSRQLRGHAHVLALLADAQLLQCTRLYRDDL
jgi:hypothetical protein